MGRSSSCQASIGKCGRAGTDLPRDGVQRQTLSANALEKALPVDRRNELGNPLGLDEGIPIETQSKMAGCNPRRNRAARLVGNTAAPRGGEAGGTLFEANPRSCGPLRYRYQEWPHH